AQSIEDNDISFNVFLYNVQEGYTIDYVTGQATKE
ncbi:MAG: DNA-entry nuclease, partial [Enterococcus aquimarinus]